MFVSKFVRQVALFSLAAVLVSSVVSAQEGGGGRPPGQEGGGGRGGRGGFGGGFGGGRMGGPGGMMQMDRARLLSIEKVRQELKIEEAQAATIEAALEAYREQRASSGGGFDREAFANMSEEERTAAFEKMNKEREELSKKTDEVLNALLEENQKTRLDQISLQIRMMMGTMATLKSDEIKTKLTLTEEQVTKLTEAETAISEERNKAMEEVRASGDFQKMGEKMAEFQKKSTEAAMAVLTDDQKKMVTEMTGPELKLEMRDFMGRGPGGGGPGGGRGPGGGGGRGGRGGDRPKSE